MNILHLTHLTPLLFFVLWQWFGEGEKYVKAVFSLASKIAPSVIFVDEVWHVTLFFIFVFTLVVPVL